MTERKPNEQAPGTEEQAEPGQEAAQAPDAQRETGNGVESQAPGMQPEGGTAGGPQEGAEPAESLESQLQAAREEAAMNLDLAQRIQAEFDNYKRRLQKEHGEALKYALTPLLRDLIGILDNLERAMEHARKEEGDSPSALLSGIEMVAKQLHATFEKFGLVRILAAGQPFDPNLHEAMTVVQTDEVPEDQVIEEFQAGYVLNDRVVRPAMVSVAKPAGPED